MNINEEKFYEQACSYFYYHAEQRTNMINYFTVVFGAGLALYGTLIKEYTVAAAMISLFMACISTLFYLIDQRNKFDVKQSQMVICEFEKACGLSNYLSQVCGMNEEGWSKVLVENNPGLDIEQFRAFAYAYVAKHQIPQLKKGAVKLLEFAKKQGIKMVVASGSTTEEVNKQMKATGIIDYFVDCIGGDAVENGKPAPDVYLKAAEVLGIDPQNCFAVEDSANGVRSAYAAGMKCIGIPDLAPLTPVENMLYAELNTLDEMIDIIKKASV